jgi:hypothetical protein
LAALIFEVRLFKQSATAVRSANAGESSGKWNAGASANMLDIAGGAQEMSSRADFTKPPVSSRRR